MNNKKKDWSIWFIGLGFTMFIASFILMVTIDNRYSFMVLCITIIGIILIILGLIVDKLRKLNENNIVEENKSEMSEWFDAKIKEYQINTDDVIICGYKHYYWINDGVFSFFPQKEDFIRCYVTISNSVNCCEKNATITNINISDIEYFKVVGDVSYITNVESTGINLKGAAIGAVIAGDAGAIIGSRPQIVSKVEARDSRHIELKYKCDDELETTYFDYTALNIFRRLFPEKEFEYAKFKSENSKKENKLNDATRTLTLEEKFQKLRSLKDAGLITEEEFSSKKDELLKQL